MYILVIIADVEFWTCMSQFLPQLFGLTQMFEMSVTLYVTQIDHTLLFFSFLNYDRNRAINMYIIHYGLF